MTRATTDIELNRENVTMHLIQEELARSHIEARHREAERAIRKARLIAARRWQRRAKEASRRARLAALAIR